MEMAFKVGNDAVLVEQRVVHVERENDFVFGQGMGDSLTRPSTRFPASGCGDLFPWHMISGACAVPPIAFNP